MLTRKQIASKDGDPDPPDPGGPKDPDPENNPSCKDDPPPAYCEKDPEESAPQETTDPEKTKTNEDKKTTATQTTPGTLSTGTFSTGTQNPACAQTTLTYEMSEYSSNIQCPFEVPLPLPDALSVDKLVKQNVSHRQIIISQ